MSLFSPAYIALYLANFFHVASFSAFFLFPLIITQQQGSQQDIGIIMGAFAFASAACRPWVSGMIDNIGRKRSYTIGCILLTVMPITHLFLQGHIPQDYPFLLLIRVIHGVGLAICFTSIFTFIIDLIPLKRLNEGIGIFGTSGLVGLAVGPMIAEFVLEGYGVRSFFLSASLLALIALVLQWPVQEVQPDNPISDKAEQPTFMTLLKTRRLLICGLLSMLFGIGLAATGNYISPFAEQRALTLISAFYFAYSSAAVLVRFFIGRLADRIGEQQIIPWGIAFATSGLFILPFVHSTTLLIVVGFIFGLGHGLLFPTLNAMAIRGQNYAIRGKVTGIFTGGIDTGAFIGAILLGFIGQHAGYNLLFIAAGLILSSGFFIFRFRVR